MASIGEVNVMKIKILTSMALLAVAVACATVTPAEAYGRNFHRIPNRYVRHNCRPVHRFHQFRHWHR
jgi:hypothetical protein